MSLLMDALRKAEADKKAAAARAAGEIPEVDPAERFARTAGELRLEPLVDTTSDSLSTSRSGEFPAGNVTQRLSASGRFRVPTANPEATLADALSFPAEPMPATGDGGTLNRPELVTARTVFAATARRGLNPLLAGGAVALLLLVGGAGLLGYRFYSQAPAPIVIPSPRVALGVERGSEPTPAAPVDPAAAGPATTPPPALTVPAGAQPTEASERAGLPETANAAPAASTPEVPAATPPPTEVAAALQQVADLPDAAPPPAPASAPAPTAAVERSRPATLPQEIEMRNGDLRIARSTDHAAVARRELTRGYAAFEAGDLAGARQAYSAVLRTLPGQRDALLGLGAVALAENRLTEAHVHYSAVLAAAPDHPVATAAMFLIEGGRGTVATEAKLKLLLDRGLDAPYLQFALGNLYAREQRWGDAQQAYFQAFRAQPRNADYAFNLAVSLDRLGQRRAALDYYRQAEALQGPNTAFDGAAVAARIAALSEP